MRIGLILCMLCGRRRNSPSNPSGFRALGRSRCGRHRRRETSATIAALALALAAPAQLLGQTAPSITSGPDDLSVQTGAQAVFQVNASGSSPITYRWFFNDTNSLSGTGSTLTVPNVSLVNAGGYSVIAS